MDLLKKNLETLVNYSLDLHEYIDMVHRCTVCHDMLKF